jgi:hypothetical protein
MRRSIPAPVTNRFSSTDEIDLLVGKMRQSPMNGHIRLCVVVPLLFKPEVMRATSAVLLNPVIMLVTITRARVLREYLISAEHFAIKETTP